MALGHIQQRLIGPIDDHRIVTLDMSFRLPPTGFVLNSSIAGGALPADAACVTSKVEAS